MIETLFCRTRVVARFRQGPLGPYMEELATTLVRERYSRETIRNYLWSIASFGAWLAEQGLGSSDVKEASMQRYLSGFRRRPSGGLTHASAGLTPLLSLLRQGGVAVGVAPPSPPSIVDQWLLGFEHHLEQVRGLTVSSVRRYRPFVRRFLSVYFDAGETSWQALTAADVAEFVYREARGRTGLGRKAPGTAVRVFLRFLVSCGEIRPGLEAAVPVMRQPSHAALPRQISADQVTEILNGCRRSTPKGLRNYAILLLLARLGLRAKEVVALRLDDIDWENGTLSLRPGKTRRERRLPLPEDVGQAIVSYLKSGRSESAHRQIFLRVRAPIVPLSGSNAVTRIVQRALQRAGLQTGRWMGAHIFRHSAASAMVCRGASFKDVADVLGHDRLHTTGIYAKLDLPALSKISLPWPGGAE